ncbi:MAG TPA: hypothetical protein VLU43_15090 [Anaeromyxobacteraceae bacterium]|nr:hypothetical protein [Anaeromyxobacteraceae bacterium]
MAPLARAALALLAVLATGACRGPRGRADRGALADGAPGVTAPPVLPAPDQTPAAGQQAPSQAGPTWALPDRTQAPWSQTQAAPLGVGERVASHEAGGAHLRLGTTAGVVHLWTPPGYAPRTAGIALYLHGYYTNVDQAWVDHRLAQQFRSSGRNALFVVPESPSWNGEDVWWPDLDALLAEVARVSGLTLPRGGLVVMGHSGAFRTILPWLATDRIDEVVLLDGLYRGEDQLQAWLAAAPPDRPRRLLLVGWETAPRTESWLTSVPDAVQRDRIPARAPGPREPDHSASIVYLRSQHDHMQIVTNGRVMPLMLQLTRLRGT